MKNIAFFLIAFACLTINSCKKENSAPNSSVAVYMKDAPAAFDAVWVEVTGVQINTVPGGWATLSVHDSIYNLLQLQDSANVLLGLTSFPTGDTINQVRLILGSRDSVVVAGISYPLLLSSEDETGLKLNVDEVVLANVSYKLVLDFVASQSIVVEGNGSYRLKPVLTATFE